MGHRHIQGFTFVRQLARGVLVRFGRSGFGERMNRRVMQYMLDGFQSSALLHAAGKLGIADLLAGGPRSSHELAQALGADDLSLHRFLRGLVVLGICSDEGDGIFGLTDLGTYLQSSNPDSFHGQAIRLAELYAAWGDILHSVMTGETAFEHVYGTSVWEYRRRVPELNEIFNRGFRASGTRIAREILSAFDFSSTHTIADIGGGYGDLLAAILKKRPSLSGILFDQQHVIADSGPRLKEAGVHERCRVVAGDFFAAIPEGADIYILKSVIHDWSDPQAEKILKNCRKALKKNSRVLLIERILPARADQDPATIMMDLRMLIDTGGHERSQGEFRSLFEKAGLTLTRIIPLRSGLNIIEGIPSGPESL